MTAIRHLLGLYWLDYVAHCAKRGTESPRRLRALALPRLLANPSLQTLLVTRLANASPRWSWTFWRFVYMRLLCAGDWSGAYTVGPGLQLPHPVGLVIGYRTRIGAEVLISHNVSIGGDAHGRTPVIGDRVQIYPGSVIIGGLTIGEGSVIGANSFVSKDVPPRSVVKRDQVEPLRDSSFGRVVDAPRLVEDA